MSGVWDVIKGIGKGVLSVIPGGGVAVAAIEGVEAVAGIIGGDAGDKVKAGTNLIKEGLAAVNEQDLSPEQRTELALNSAKHEREMKRLVIEEKRLNLTADREASEHTTDRAAKLEGTAKDLLKAGFVGRVILFLRSCQRVCWGFGTLYADLMLLSGVWDVELTRASGNYTAEGFLVIAVNILVLGFLFGERTIQNLAPAIERIAAARAAAVGATR